MHKSLMRSIAVRSLLVLNHDADFSNFAVPIAKNPGKYYQLYLRRVLARVERGILLSSVEYKSFAHADTQPSTQHITFDNFGSAWHFKVQYKNYFQYGLS